MYEVRSVVSDYGIYEEKELQRSKGFKTSSCKV